MIISHKHKFVFLRSCKTGSTSTALAIRQSGILDLSEDVSNFVEGPIEDEFHRPLNMPETMPSESNFAEVAPHTNVWLNPAKKAMHLNLPELVALGFLTAEQAREYKTYVGIREPLDKMVSAAHFLLKRAPKDLFRQYRVMRPRTVQQVFDYNVINAAMPILGMPQSHWFQTDNPDQLRFILFDDLPGEVAAMVNGFGGNWSAAAMPTKKSGVRDKQSATAENLLRPETVEQLKTDYRQDSEYWAKAKQSRAATGNAGTSSAL